MFCPLPIVPLHLCHAFLVFQTPPSLAVVRGGGIRYFIGFTQLVQDVIVNVIGSYVRKTLNL